MKTQEQEKNKAVVIKQENKPNPYAGKALNSDKEIAAKKFAGTAMDILKRSRSAK